MERLGGTVVTGRVWYNREKRGVRSLEAQQRRIFRGLVRRKAQEHLDKVKFKEEQSEVKDIVVDPLGSLEVLDLDQAHGGDSEGNLTFEGNEEEAKEEKDPYNEFGCDWDPDSSVESEVGEEGVSEEVLRSVEKEYEKLRVEFEEFAKASSSNSSGSGRTAKNLIRGRLSAKALADFDKIQEEIDSFKGREHSRFLLKVQRNVVVEKDLKESIGVKGSVGEELLDKAKAGLSDACSTCGPREERATRGGPEADQQADLRFRTQILQKTAQLDPGGPKADPRRTSRRTCVSACKSTNKGHRRTQGGPRRTQGGPKADLRFRAQI